MLNFWALRCPYCVDELPYFQQVHEKYHQDRGLEILAANIEDSAGAIEAFMQENGYTFTVLFDTGAAIARQYGVRGIPVTVFIDKNGIIREVAAGGFLNVEQVENRLESILD